MKKPAKKVRVYKFYSPTEDFEWIAFEADAIGSIKDFLDVLPDLDVGQELRIVVDEMSERQFKRLPEG